MFNFIDLFEIKKKLTGLLYDVSVGLVKDYQKTAVDIAKIEAASFYVKIVQAVRRQFFFMTLMVFGLVVFANAMMVLQVAILLYAPWGIKGKILSAVLIGSIGFVPPLVFITRFFSEERWMKITKADACVSNALEKNGSE